MSAVARVFSPKVEAPPAPPPPPMAPPVGQEGSAEQQKTQEALNAAADQERKAKGRAATLLTGGQGDQTQAEVSKRTLLGA